MLGPGDFLNVNKYQAVFFLSNSPLVGFQHNLISHENTQLPTGKKEKEKGLPDEKMNDRELKYFA